MSKLAHNIEKNWYRPSWRNAWLLPLWCLSASFIFIKRQLFLLSRRSAPAVPVLVVGNINVGGTGKTPLIVYLVQRAQALGLQPAVVSRGYGGTSKDYPLLVNEQVSAADCGDEPKLLQQRLQCTVVVDPQRMRAVNMAIAQGANIIFSDDGLQHYKMARSGEIIVVDGQRQFGNQWLLPIGPLREPISRLFSADLVLVNGKDFQVRAEKIYHLASGKAAKMDSVQNKVVDAVCGLGNPQRFYDTLRALGAKPIERSFADHHAFSAADLDFEDGQKILIMTEKDAVKCRAFAQNHWWYLTVEAVPSAQAAVRIDRLLQRLVKN